MSLGDARASCPGECNINYLSPPFWASAVQFLGLTPTHSILACARLPTPLTTRVQVLTYKHAHPLTLLGPATHSLQLDRTTSSRVWAQIQETLGSWGLETSIIQVLDQAESCHPETQGWLPQDSDLTSLSDEIMTSSQPTATQL